MGFFRRYGPSWWIRLIALAILDGIIIAIIPALIDQGAQIAAFSMVVGAIGVNYVFLSPRTYAFRWLVPGLIFLSLLMIWPIVFTVWIALTNWSTGNFITETQAIESITTGPTYLLDTDDARLVELYLYRDDADVNALDQAAGVTMLVRTPEGEIFYGVPRLTSQEAPEDAELLELADFDVVDEDGDGLPESIGTARVLVLRDIGSVGNVLQDLVLDIPGRGRASAQGFNQAILAEQRFRYDADAGVLVDALGGTCTPEEGTFVCTSGERLDPGFRTFIGFDNFSDILTDNRVRTPFLRVFVWNVVFASAVVFIQLVIGLGLALTFNDERMRFKNWYRTMLIIPYAAPAFISVLVWRGLLNQSFGPVNRLLDPVIGVFGAESINWLNDPFWAKIAVILVTVWQGFAYFFLITSGALQAIPKELQEAARVDGAAAPQVFRRITFPLLMVGVAPLIIASFAFNFNAFVNIFLLTGGGPPITGYAVPVGETDILISYTFNLAIGSGRGGQLALAAANTFFIFFIVATIAAVSFRFTKRLETIYGNL